MATRAIRYNKLNFGNTNQANDALHWIHYRHNDMKIRTPLQEACIHGITHAGDSAEEIQQDLNNMMNELHSMNNFYQMMNHVYAHLVPYLIHVEMQNHGLDSFMRKKLTEMRDYAKANTTQHPHYGHAHFDGRSDQTYMDMFNELTQEMSKVASSVNAKYFPPALLRSNYGYNNSGIVQPNLHYGVMNVETTDEQIESYTNILNSTHYGHIWRLNTYYFLRGGFRKRDSKAIAHTYPKIPVDVMESFMEYLTENKPILALMIAKNQQFLLDNPQIRSIGHSWTSKNRSEDCWFNESYDQVNKKNTTVFAPPVNLFGQFIPSLTDMLDVLKTKKADILQFLDDVQPIIKSKKDAQQALQDKTDKSIEEAMVTVIQGLLDDPATVEVGTAIIAQIAGIATLPIDMTQVQPQGAIPYTYHDFQQKKDVVCHLYPHHLREAVPLSAFNITDEVQATLYDAYRKELESYRANHANRCAQLARQIAQATTRHDAEVKTLMEAFNDYRAQV